MIDNIKCKIFSFLGIFLLITSTNFHIAKSETLSDWEKERMEAMGPASFYLTMSSVKYRQGNYPLAIIFYTKAIDLNPNYEYMQGLYSGRAAAKEKVGDYQGAISDYTKAISLDYNEPLNYFLRGYIKFQLNDYKGAIYDYSKGIRLKPDRDPVYFSILGFSKIKIGDKEGGCADFRKGSSLGDQDSYENLQEFCN